MNHRRCRKFLVTTGCVELVVVSYDSTTIHMESTKRAQPRLDTLEYSSLSFVPRETRKWQLSDFIHLRAIMMCVQQTYRISLRFSFQENSMTLSKLRVCSHCE